MNWYIAAQIGGIIINLITAIAMWKVKRDVGFAVAFASYAVACAGYAFSILQKGV